MKKLALFISLSVLAVSVSAASVYQASEKVGKGKFDSSISYLAMAGDAVCALELNGTVRLFDADSCKQLSSFKTGLNNTQAIAVNGQNEIFVFATSTREEERKSRTRKYKVQVPIGVSCKVFNKDGRELRALKLDCLKSARSAQFVDGKLVVADMGQRTLFVLDPATGEKQGEIKDRLRLCCGIFDFCPGPDNTVAIANLGSFQVLRYDLNGKKISSFGRRGKTVHDFHGCCNPVSAGYLADGSIVTVEKSPTRVKVYDSEGKKARVIDGVEELVQGCSYIPIAIDGNNNIFLGASRKGYLVKCVPNS